jgi:hypothetical protein
LGVAISKTLRKLRRKWLTDSTATSSVTWMSMWDASLNKIGQNDGYGSHNRYLYRVTPTSLNLATKKHPACRRIQVNI